MQKSLFVISLPILQITEELWLIDPYFEGQKLLLELSQRGCMYSLHVNMQISAGMLKYSAIILQFFKAFDKL